MGGRNTANKCHWRLWGVLAVSGPYWVCPHSWYVCFPGLKWVLGCVRFPGLSCSGSGSQVLHKGTDLVGPAFCALPRSEQLRRPGVCRAHSPQVGRCILSPPLSQPLHFLGVKQECCLRCAVCRLWGADFWLRPSWQMSTIQDPRKTWLVTGSLLTVW